MQSSSNGRRIAPSKIENYVNTLLEPVDRQTNTTSMDIQKAAITAGKKRGKNFDRKRINAGVS